MSGYNRPGYNYVGNWSWEFYPPPYDFLAPPNSAPQPAPVLGGRGLSGCHCGGKCGHCGAAAGGLGLFDSGLDLSQWGVAEWLIAAGGLYLGASLFSDVKRVSGSARKSYRRRSQTSRRKAELERELSAL